MLDRKLVNVLCLKDGDWVPAEIGIENGQIVDAGESVSGSSKEEVDGDGAYCFPGAVDLHVHFNDPGTDWEGFDTGSAAAVAGGVTYVADMPLNNLPSTVSIESLQEKLTSVQGRSYVDYGLWGGVVPGNADHLLPMAEAGVMGFKAFMSPSGNESFEHSDIPTLREAMKRIAGTGLRLALHAEDPFVLSMTAEKMERKSSAYHWEESRPVEAELSAVKFAIELASETGCPITIVHVSSPEVLDFIQKAKVAGVDILCETCPHYLLLSLDDAALIGPDAKCAPPLRPVETVEMMQEYLMSGNIDTIGSDHSPCTAEMKHKQNFFDVWGGISGVQHGLPMLIDFFSLDDTVAMKRLQEVSVSNPAVVVGLDQKKNLTVGADADFYLVKERARSREVMEKELLYKHAHSAYCGRNMDIQMISTWLRGECVIQHGKIVGEVQGRFIKGKAAQ